MIDHLPPVIDITPYMLADGGALDVDRCPDCWERRAHIERYAWACKVCAGGMRVLDFGCGVGYGSEMLRDAGNDVAGIDSSAHALTLASDRRGNLRPLHFTFQHHVPSWPFDACVAFEVLEHLTDPAESIRTVPARHLVLSVPVRAEDDNPHHKQRFTIESIEALVRTRFAIASRWVQMEPFHFEPSIYICHAEAHLWVTAL